jgi:hypothetical protein
MVSIPFPCCSILAHPLPDRLIMTTTFASSSSTYEQASAFNASSSCPPPPPASEGHYHYRHPSIDHHQPSASPAASDPTYLNPEHPHPPSHYSYPQADPRYPYPPPPSHHHRPHSYYDPAAYPGYSYPPRHENGYGRNYGRGAQTALVEVEVEEALEVEQRPMTVREAELVSHLGRLQFVSLLPLRLSRARLRSTTDSRRIRTVPRYCSFSLGARSSRA